MKKYNIFFNINNRNFLFHIFFLYFIFHMLSDKEVNKNQTLPAIVNQFPNNTSQIINYYINLSENLNMSNNLNNAQTQDIPINGNTNHPPFEKQVTNQIFNNGLFFNTLMNMSNYYALFQVSSAYQQYFQFFRNINNCQENENQEKLKKKDNLIGNKRKTEEKCEEYSRKSIKSNKNIKIIEKEKNGNFIKNKNEDKVVKSYNLINNIGSNESSNFKKGKKLKLVKSPQKELTFEKKTENEQKLLESGKNINENINLGQSKKGNRINKYKELLQDTLLENLDKHKEEITIIINNKEFEQSKRSKLKKKLASKKSNTASGKLNKNKKNNNKSNKSHFTNNKNFKANISFQPTKCIFHGDNYEKTNSPNEFMKYNYNFIEEENHTKLINKTENRIDNLQKLMCRNNDENRCNLSDIKPVWLRSEFKGSDIELKNYINNIKEFKEKRDEKNEEECLIKIFEKQKKKINNINN